MAMKAAKVIPLKPVMVTAINEKNVIAANTVIDVAKKSIVSEAQKVIDNTPLTKGASVKVLWRGDTETGAYIGAAGFAMSTMLIVNDVGVVVIVYSSFGSCAADIKRLQDERGFKTLGDALQKGNDFDKARAESVKKFLQHFQREMNSGSKSVKAYESVLEQDTGMGYQIRKVNCASAKKVLDKFLKLNVMSTPLPDLMTFCLDMSGVGRQLGESTIDARKKPVLLVIVGAPGVEQLKTTVKLMSRVDLQIKIHWSDKPVVEENVQFDNKWYSGTVAAERSVSVVFGDLYLVARDKHNKAIADDMGRPVLDLTAREFGGAYGESYEYTKCYGDQVVKILKSCDVMHVLRRDMVRQTVEMAEDIAIMHNDPTVTLDEDADAHIQRLPDAEIQEIVKAATTYDKRVTKDGKSFEVGLLAGLEGIKQEYQSAKAACDAACARVEENGYAVGMSRLTIQNMVAREKQLLSTILDGLTNKARLLFDTCENLSVGKKVQISPVDRARCVWDVVLQHAKQETGGYAWKKVSTFAQNLLGPEYTMWAAMLEDGVENSGAALDTEQQVYLKGRFAEMPDEFIEQKLQNKEFAFIDGQCTKKGQLLMTCKKAITGKFKVVVKHDSDMTRYFAIMPIKDTVEALIPAANPNRLIIKLQSGASAKEVERVAKQAMDAPCVLLLKGWKKSDNGGSPLAVYDGKQVRQIGYFNLPQREVPARIFDISYDQQIPEITGYIGCRGKVVKKIVFQYEQPIEDTTITRYSAFLVIDKQGAAMPEERNGMIRL